MTIEAQDKSIKQSTENSLKAEDPVYSWGGGPLEITKDRILEIQNKTKDPFTAVDLCSAYPIYRQLLIENHRDESLQRANTIVGKFIEAIERERSSVREFKLLDEETKTTIKRISKDRIFPARQLLTAAVHEILFDSPDLTGEDHQKKEKLTQLVRQKMQTGRRIYSRDWELKDMVGQGRWQIIDWQDENPTFEEIIKYHGNKNIDFASFFSETATFLAENIEVSKLKKFGVITIDLKNIATLRELANRSGDTEDFPEYYRNTQLFKRAGEENDPHAQHIQADILKYSLEQNSASLITSFEGFPWYFDGIKKEEQAHLAHMLAKALHAGGKLIFFPWGVKNDTPANKAMLDNMIRVWKKAGLTIHIEKYEPKRMSQRAQALAKRSQIFGKKVLIAEKPLKDNIETYQGELEEQKETIIFPYLM